MVPSAIINSRGFVIPIKHAIRPRVTIIRVGCFRVHLSRDPGADDDAVMTFTKSEEGCRRSGDSGKAGRDRKSRVQILVFPGRLERGFEQDLSDLPLVEESEPYVGAERVLGIRLDLHGCQRAAESADVHVGVLQCPNGTDGQRTKMKIVATAEKGAPLGSPGFPLASPSSPERKAGSFGGPSLPP
jgi:hypothetical protein